MPTKTLTSFLLLTELLTSKISQPSRVWRKKDRFERLLRRHDRKGELRAGIFGISPQEFKNIQKRLSFDEVVHRYGFSSEHDFQLAFLGKIRSELMNRGWSRRRIDLFVIEKRNRMS